MLRPFVGGLLLAAIAGTACTGSDSVGQPPPISVPDADSLTRAGSGTPTLRIGSIVSSAAPSADRDRAIIEVFRHTIEAAATERSVQLEVITIDEESDAEAAVSALTELGVTVLVTTCDSGSIPALLAASSDAGLLAVTGCPTIPHAAVDDRPAALTIHLAALDDNAAAMARWAELQGHVSAATLSSTLVGDVDSTCADFEEFFGRTGTSVEGSIEFSGLLDDPLDTIGADLELLSGVDVIAVCALPGTAAEVVKAVRSAELHQPIVAPWFAEGEDWDRSLSNVYVVAPAGTLGDDPSEQLNELFESSDTGLRSAAAVGAEAIDLLISVADSSNSVGSRSLDEALLAEPHESRTGQIAIDPESRRVEARQYRVLEVVDGRAGVVSTVSASG